MEDKEKNLEQLIEVEELEYEESMINQIGIYKKLYDKSINAYNKFLKDRRNYHMTFYYDQEKGSYFYEKEPKLNIGFKTEDE